MKIAHIVQNYFPSLGGTQTLFRNVSERLANQFNDEVTVFTTNSFLGPEKPLFKKIQLIEETIESVNIKRFAFFKFQKPIINVLLKFCIKLGLNNLKHRLVSLYLGPWSPSMIKAVIAYQPDIICASSSDYLYMQLPLYLQKHHIRIPFVFMGAVHFKEDESYHPLAPRTLEAIHLSDAYIANTTYEKERLIKYGVNADKIKVVGCGVALEDFNKVYDGSLHQRFPIGQKKVIGYVGRHEASKGIDTLIDAMQLLWQQGEDCFLLIAGSVSPYTEQLLAKLKALPPAFQQHYALVSNFTDEEKKQIYLSLDVFVSVSKAESFGIVYLEAWACKKAVIGANIGAVRSVISDNKDGFIVEPDSPDTLANRIQQLTRDKALAQQLGENGYQKVKAQYTWDIIAAKYRAVYTEVLDAPIP
jgi:glycosyltransferase involved in cell wall biosynthesis